MITGHEGVAAVAVPDPYRKCIPRFMCDPLFFRERHLGYRAKHTCLGVCLVLSPQRLKRPSAVFYIYLRDDTYLTDCYLPAQLASPI